MRILVVEDHKKIAESLQEGLRQESYAVDIEHDGEQAFASAMSEAYDLLLLDVMLPGMSGYELCAKLRANDVHTPILMLTAKNQTQDVVEGLNAGADDYLAKPFAFEELLARVRALLRRPQKTSGDILQAGGLTLNTATHKVTRVDQNIELSHKEFALLEYLLRNKGSVVSKENIMAHVWSFDANILPNTVEVFVAYLRAKIDKPFQGLDPIIYTVRGAGYTVKEGKQ